MSDSPDGRRRFPSGRRTLAVVAAIVAVAASIGVSPGRKPSTRVVLSASGSPSSPVPTGGPGGNSRTVVVRGGATAGPALEAPPGVACAPGLNGDATDTGVTATEIKLGATVVDSGVGASFLADARYGMIAIKDKINRAGGICGRRLNLILVDDGWDFRLGGDFIRNLVEDKKVFALAVVPSSEGLKNVSDAGYLRKKRIPVVGSDGMLIHQYTDPYIWPVAASTVSTMHIMAKHAADAFKAGRFAIVYESTYHFGIEGAFAFNAAVKRLTGKDIPGYSDPLRTPKCERRFCGISDGAASYATEIQTFNASCQQDPVCDFVALLLEPATALAWLKGGGLSPNDGWRTGGVQPLFTRRFAEECAAECNHLWLWTGYDPPIGANLRGAAMTAYVDDIRGASSSADYHNTFVEGAYIGMRFLVEALQRVGPNLTRANLRAVLDTMTFDSGLAPPLVFRPGDHFANVRMNAYSIQYRDRFAGWKDERTSVGDPWVGMDIP